MRIESIGRTSLFHFVYKLPRADDDGGEKK